MSRPRSRSLKRHFELNVAGPWPLNELVLQLFDGLEKETVTVYSPGDLKAFDLSQSTDGRIDLAANATEKVKIVDWVSAVCQLIRMECLGESEQLCRSSATVAWYSNNAHNVLFPIDGEHQPLGPAALTGEIVLTHRHCAGLLADATQRNINVLSFIIAHELVHAFDMLPIVVPAFRDWDAYWNIALGSGANCSEPLWRRSFQTLLLDDYGSESELRCVEEYWPTHAKVWFEACRGALSESNRKQSTKAKKRRRRSNPRKAARRKK